MCTSEQASAERRLRMQPKVMDPAERRRHLRKVYHILLALAEQTEAASQDIPRDQPLPVGLEEAIGCRLQTGTDSLDWHQAQADLDGFVYLLHRPRGQTPPTPAHPPLVYRSDLV